MECRQRALAGVADGDWRAVHDWTKSWVGWGGGAWVTDTWLLYAVSALLEGKPKNAVHSLDLGLRTWIEGDADRAVLLWCRGLVIWSALNDPKTAMADLTTAGAAVPSWLTDDPDGSIGACRQAADRSRKRVASVKPAPRLHVPRDGRGFVAPPIGHRVDGSAPLVWEDVKTFFTVR